MHTKTTVYQKSMFYSWGAHFVSYDWDIILNEIMSMCNMNISDIPQNLVQDSMPDCFDGRDEQAIISDEIPHTITTCKDRKSIPCFPGDTRCFFLHQQCIYEFHDLLGPGFLKPCRNGKHLANCSAALCPHHFKCQNYYCVPYKYTCDGKQDCPLGDDEHKCTNRTCVGLLKCHNIPCRTLPPVTHGRILIWFISASFVVFFIFMRPWLTITHISILNTLSHIFTLPISSCTFWHMERNGMSDSLRSNLCIQYWTIGRSSLRDMFWERYHRNIHHH